METSITESLNSCAKGFHLYLFGGLHWIAKTFKKFACNLKKTTLNLLEYAQKYLLDIWPKFPPN